jgi:hypothetical protein
MDHIIDDVRMRSDIWRLKGRLETVQGMTLAVFINELESLHRDLLIVVSRKKFAYIYEEVIPYFEQDYLFGAWVYDRFPEIREDIKDAGNCIAAGLPTAAVFHLMRIAEFGFRHTATKARVKLTDNKKPLPIDYAGWEKIVQGLDAVSKEIRRSPKGPKRERKATFYASLVEQCGYFRDVYRDKTMHHRKRYNHNEAVGAFLRVKEFITLLAGPSK